LKRAASKADTVGFSFPTRYLLNNAISRELLAINLQIAVPIREPATYNLGMKSRIGYE